MLSLQCFILSLVMLLMHERFEIRHCNGNINKLNGSNLIEILVWLGRAYKFLNYISYYFICVMLFNVCKVMY
jgi:hypothetical protein